MQRKSTPVVDSNHISLCFEEMTTWWETNFCDHLKQSFPRHSRTRNSQSFGKADEDRECSASERGRDHGAYWALLSVGFDGNCQNSLQLPKMLLLHFLVVFAETVLDAGDGQFW